VPTPERALLLENIHSDAAWTLKDAGYDVDRLDRALGTGELAERLAGVRLLGIRSNTTVTAEVLDAAPDLLAVGAFCIGTNQIDLAAAPSAGSPSSTRRSATPAASSSWRCPRSSR
jgi:D-3-phosphoglycerate dehydrogenase